VVRYGALPYETAEPERYPLFAVKTKVGRLRLTVSKPVLTGPVVSELDNILSLTGFIVYFHFNLHRYTKDWSASKPSVLVTGGIHGQGLMDGAHHVIGCQERWCSPRHRHMMPFDSTNQITIEFDDLSTIR
jgi:hypothetical protein